MTKAELRREMRARLRTALTPSAREEKSRAICATIARHAAWLQARTVALFDAMPAEPQLGGLWELAPRRFVYPRVHDEELLLIETPDRAALLAHEAGASYREPVHRVERIVAPEAIDLILVPGLAFTRDGRRLGRGGGFYDRLLARLSPATPKLGVCFTVQLVEGLPTEPHDLRVDAVITEAGEKSEQLPHVA